MLLDAKSRAFVDVVGEVDFYSCQKKDGCSYEEKKILGVESPKSSTPKRCYPTR
jgi:hypothetical protein